MNIAIIGRRCGLTIAPALALSLAVGNLPAQTSADSGHSVQARGDSALDATRAHFYRRFAAGFAASIVLHEAAHYASSYAMGYHPHFGFDKGRPTAFSGIDEFGDRRAQFIFSAAGLTAQDILDELILDIPHQRGSALERGALAGGIATTLFYVTVGRNARVSDITVMSRTSHLSKSQLSLIFGSVAAVHAFRMSRNSAYSHFFLAPGDAGSPLKAGLSFGTH